ncbi:AAA family ATPase [Microbacterium sp. 1P10UB]|uniref:MinD/ParA family ATP-binding protein n=1 Tax=unclassified Microbacterium TaxID=2609290 RepID=UPI0039A243F1
MTPDRNDQQPEDSTEHGVLDDSGNLDVARLDILGGPATEQISVIVPAAHDDDLLDDDVVDDELDPARIDDELNGAELSVPADPETTREESADSEATVEDVVIVDFEDDDDPDDSRPVAAEQNETATASDAEIVDVEVVDDADIAGDGSAPADSAVADAAALSAAFDARVREEMDAAAAAAVAATAAAVSSAATASPTRPASPYMTSRRAVRTGAVPLPPREAEPARAEQPASAAPSPSVADAPAASETPAAEPTPAAAQTPAEPVASQAAAAEPAETVTAEHAETEAAREPEPASVPAPEATAPEPAEVPDAPAPARAIRRPAPEPADRTQALERVTTRPDVALTSKRLGEFEVGRESSDLLTADRLLDPSMIVRPEPEGAWRHFIYRLTGKRINLGDGRAARRRKELDRRIAVPLSGNARFVPVLSRKGGVGKTTVTTLLGMALADARDDRIIAIDANPDRGTLAERIAKASGKTIRDLVRVRSTVRGYNDISAVVSRDETRLDVLASDSDPRVSEALSDTDYQDVASLAAHYYSIVLTDTGTGIVHSVMGATLEVADQIVVVAGLSVDEARLASETLTWLETNGYAEQVRTAVVVLNSGRPGAPMVRPDELEAHFRTRVRAVVRVPYDPLIAAGSAITFRDLQPETRLAARQLAAAVVEGLRALPAAA